MSIPTPACTPAARPDPAPRAASPAGAGRPMDRTGGMENAHDTLAADCTRVEARFPPRLGRHRTPPTRPTGKIVVLFEHDVTAWISCAGCEPMGGNWPRNVAALRRAFHFAGIRVPDPPNRCSTSAKYALRARVQTGSCLTMPKH